MIDNIDIAYCMAKLEDKIRWSTMIDDFEVAFGVDYH